MVRQVRPAKVGEPLSPSSSPPRKPLHESKESHTNSLRIVPSTPPQFLGTAIATNQKDRDPVYGRTPLPTSSSHLLPPPPGTTVVLGLAGQGSALEGRVSKTPVASPSSGSISFLETPHRPSGAATGSPTSIPLKTKKKLQVHPDNPHLFSLVASGQDLDDGGLSRTPNTLSTKSSYEFISSDTDLRSFNSATSCMPDPFSPRSAAHPTAPSSPIISADPISTSPWDYRLVERTLRKVPKTPESKSPKGKAIETSDTPPLPLPPPPETLDDPPTNDLSSKPSFATTLSDNTNYRVYHRDSSPPPHLPPSSPVAEAATSPSESNWKVLGLDSSPAQSSVVHRPENAGENWQVLGVDSSPAPSFVDYRPQTSDSDDQSIFHVPHIHTTHADYSQESLVVPPLNTRGRRSNGQFGYYKSRSRESLRSGSLTSISTVLSQQEAQRAVIGSGSLIQLPILKRAIALNSWASSSKAARPMNETAHQWSSQLSTIESEGGTDRGSRSWSDSNRRSTHSRQMLSISSSMAAEEESRSRTDSLEPPQPSYARSPRLHSSPSIRVVEDQDEYGDGITDMVPDLRQRPSRQRLSTSAASNDGRTSTMKSTSSSRTNSLLRNSLPTWARIYYGSGERNWLQTSASSLAPDSRSNSLSRSFSPSDVYVQNIYSPRRRPREGGAQVPRGQGERPGSLDITPARPATGPLRTSSVWSPHLRIDLAARARRNLWEAPSTTSSSFFGQTNRQIWLFAVGFIFPFAWFVASFLKLPPNPMEEMRERDSSEADLENSRNYDLEMGPADEKRYESARWWRRLNRYMSFVGLLIIGLVIGLVVRGLEENW